MLGNTGVPAVPGGAAGGVKGAPPNDGSRRVVARDGDDADEGGEDDDGTVKALPVHLAPLVVRTAKARRLRPMSADIVTDLIDGGFVWVCGSNIYVKCHHHHGVFERSREWERDRG
jgi:hypothetical protein